MHKCLAGLLLTAAALAQPKPLGLGRAASAEEIAKVNLTVYPDGKGLPAGSGTAEKGRPLFKAKCAACHNDNGEGREAQYPALTGGIGSLTSGKPRKTVGSYWPYSTTVFDFIRRAMPFDHPRSLTAGEAYSLTAFVLHLNGIVAEKQELNDKTLPGVRMPNRDGFVLHKRPAISR